MRSRGCNPSFIISHVRHLGYNELHLIKTIVGFYNVPDTDTEVKDATRYIQDGVHGK
jgi:hypothetical protein